MLKILDPLIETLQEGKEAVLCAIVRNNGSAPRTSGARMLVRADGAICGSVGGGALEGACQAKAAELFRGRSPFAELHFNLDAASAAEQGMVCGGNLTVLLQLVGPDTLPLFRQLEDDYRAGRRPILLTVLPKDGLPPRLTLLTGKEDGDIPAVLQVEILRKFRRANFLVDYNGLSVFVEPLVHPGRIILAGAGHVGLAVAHIAAFVGFEVTVMDDRREFADPTRFPKAREVRILGSFDDCIDELGPDDYVIIVTRSHLHDREVLAQALGTSAGYIGMIGSRQKREAVYESLRGEGVTEEDLDRVHCPIGLAIGADTPEEIALSIVAELVQIRAGKSE